MIAVAIISETVLDRGSFMPAARQMTGHNHVCGVDKKPGLSQLADDMTIIQDFAHTDINLTTSITYIGLLVGGFDEDIDEFVAYTRGMPHVPSTQIEQRGVRAIVISGSLDQWRLATIEGCTADPKSPVRGAFNQIHVLLSQRGLGSLFEGLRPVYATNGTFLLEQR